MLITIYNNNYNEWKGVSRSRKEWEGVIFILRREKKWEGMKISGKEPFTYQEHRALSTVKTNTLVAKLFNEEVATQ